jgi:hypothetical protein
MVKGKLPNTVKAEHDTVPAHDMVVVGVVASVFTPVAYTAPPWLKADEVERPPKLRVVPVRMTGQVAEIVACLLLNVFQSVEVSRPERVALAFWNRDEVAIAVGTADALVLFPRTEFAATAARPIVPVLVMVPPVKPLFVATDVTVPEPGVMQVPLYCRQPETKFMPFANVDVPVPVFAKPPAMVVVAVVDETVNGPKIVVSCAPLSRMTSWSIPFASVVDK